MTVTVTGAANGAGAAEFDILGGAAELDVPGRLEYLSASRFLSRHLGLAGGVAAILAWRTGPWSDRSVATAILLIQLHGFPPPPVYGSPPRPGRKPSKVASLDRIARLLGYEQHTPLVRRAVNRLIGAGWIRVAGDTGPGRSRCFEFWPGAEPRVPDDRPDEAAVAAAAMRIEWPRIARIARIMRSKGYRQLYADAIVRARGE